ncbi:MAG: PQQ-dependent sugar dehydrogenase [Sphingomicrobium sp.]
MTMRPILVPLVALAAACTSQAPGQAESAAPFVSTPVATFDSPWAMAFIPGSSAALVTEKPGRMWLVDLASGGKQPVSGAPEVVVSGQGGLLDVAVSPRFAADRLVYLTFAEQSANGGSGLALARARLDGMQLRDLRVIWRDSAGGKGGQFGGIIAFAPHGNSLFLTIGDRQRFTSAQDASEPLGKILHLTLDGAPAPGNPWADRAAPATVEVTDPPSNTEAAKRQHGRWVALPGPNRTPAQTWSLGHRNPYGLAFNAQGVLWETEMGPRGGDELNRIVRGRNYGWPLVSEGRNYDGVAIPPHSSRPDLEPPILSWNPVISPTSLVIYSGSLFPAWKGNGFIGALSATGLVRVTFDGGQARKADQWDLGARIRWVGEGPGGALYLLEDGDGGRLLRLTPPAQERR